MQRRYGVELCKRRRLATDGTAACRSCCVVGCGERDEHQFHAKHVVYFTQILSARRQGGMTPTSNRPDLWQDSVVEKYLPDKGDTKSYSKRHQKSALKYGGRWN